MTTLKDKILKRIRPRGRGKWVCTPKDFLDLGSRAAVDQVLSRLTKSGQLRRVGHGLYDLPRNSRVLGRPAPVNVDAAVAAVARRDGIRVVPDGLLMANRLGLTNAVPAKADYLTDGDSRTMKIGGRTVRLKHANRNLINMADNPAGPVANALLWLGRPAASNPRSITLLRRRLPDNVKQDLKKRAVNLPMWAAQIANEVAQPVADVS